MPGRTHKEILVSVIVRNIILWLRGGKLNSFRDSLLCSEWGGACLGMHQLTSQSVLLNVSYHKKPVLWFIGGDLNGF